MSNKLRIIGGLLCCGALMLFAACGGNGQSNECQFTSDCSQGQVCYTGGQANQCVKKCEQGSECSSGTCTDKVEGGGKGCKPASTGGSDAGNIDTMTGGDTMTSGCTTNEDCGNNEVCNKPKGS
ncbi:MAG: hypothetical protein ABEN55_08650, partial [Bradymonadaceae bacterium]